MKILHHSTPITPEVTLQPEQHHLTLRGECYPENPVPFFGTVLAELEVHLQRDVPAKLDVTFGLTYVNSASTKALRRLFVRLDRLAQTGTEVLVEWEHEADDELTVELGRDLASNLHHIDFEEIALEARATA